MRAVVISALAVLALGCEADLGVCDLPAATGALVYDLSDGTPYYLGQALVRESCAGAFCHTATAMRAGRVGAPHGLDFDVAVLGDAATPSDLARLRDGVATIREARSELYDLVEGGEMPPGAAGAAAASKLPWGSRDASGTLVATALPDLRGGAGREVFRNWLACGAPIVAAVTSSPQAAPAAALGGVEPAGVAAAVEPTLASIFEHVLQPKCAACHNRNATNPYLTVQALDFDSAASAHATLVGVDAFATGMCAAQGKLVVPGDCQSSLLYAKLREQDPSAVCGDPMPAVPPALPDAALQAICTWIDQGATP